MIASLRLTAFSSMFAPSVTLGRSLFAPERLLVGWRVKTGTLGMLNFSS